MSGHLITTPVTADLCPRCKAVILIGWAEGLHARVDPTPLNRDGEIATLLAGLQTYTLTRSGLVHRDATRIAGGTLSKCGRTVPQHKCGRHIPAEHREVIAPNTAQPQTEECPF